ncbi:MAG TPA: 5'-nucleotidase C-terminal domain-containing protein [Pyrinomonadaceae bacterium]|nr:5'-nucleotidase C-terminal domain-containing protein [Pyrinomonadaceae bacterium]
MRLDPRLPYRWALMTLLVVAIILAVSSGVIPIGSAQQQAECTTKITLLQVNDVYQFAPVDRGTRGGIARVMTLKKEIQKESPNTIFLLAGDTISPSVESITYKGAQMIDSWNAAGLDYATFGNHEFDFGPKPDVLLARMKESRFVWLAANVIDRTTGVAFGGAQPYVIREFDGVKIGIFGLVLPETKTTSRPGPDIDFLNPCEVAQKTVKEIHGRGAKVVVALTHLSMREDKEVARCADVDVIIGGHEHTLLESAAGGAPIFKMTADARELGRIDLNISKTSGELESIDWKVIPVTSEIKEDPEFASVNNKYQGLMKELSEVLGRSTEPLDARSAESRTRETNIGNFIADTFRQALKTDVTLMNGGSIRADTIISAGELTRRDVLSILPFKNKVVKLEVTGATLRAALEHGVGRSAEDSEPGRFPQVGGIRFTFDATRPSGSRIVTVTVNEQPLDNNRKYTLATMDFLAGGGDGYDMLKQARRLITPEQAESDFDILRRTIMTARTIAPKIDGRIRRLDSAARQKPNCPSGR